MTIGVLGAGAFGTSLAIAMSDRPVMLWARDADHALEMRRNRENIRRLSGVALPDQITVTHHLTDLSGHETVLLAVPTQTLAGLLAKLPDIFGTKNLIACCKGVDLKTARRPTEIIKHRFPNATTAVLTGPSFAADIAAGLPTALTLACEDQDKGTFLQRQLSAPALRLYRSPDCIGAELGGALKNVIAIAAGATIGAGLGESARAALMTRGFAEMTRFAVHHGAAAQTLAGLSGFGDLVLTCSSDESRNYRYGVALGAGHAFDRTLTVEGASTAKAILNEAQSLNTELPITEMVVALMSGQVTVASAVSALLQRPLREE